MLTCLVCSVLVLLLLCRFACVLLVHGLMSSLPVLCVIIWLAMFCFSMSVLAGRTGIVSAPHGSLPEYVKRKKRSYDRRRFLTTSTNIELDCPLRDATNCCSSAPVLTKPTSTMPLSPTSPLGSGGLEWPKVQSSKIPLPDPLPEN